MSQEIQEIIVEINPKTGEMIGPVGRDDAHNPEKPIPHAVAFTLICTRDKNADFDTGLFQVRGPDVKAFPNYLTLTAVGHITYEEDKALEILAKETALRELAQETGLVQSFPFKLVAHGFLGLGKDQQYMFVYLAYVDELPTVEHVQEEEVATVLALSNQEFLAWVESGKVTPFALEALRLIGFIP